MTPLVKLARRLGHDFNRADLLDQALTHRSFGSHNNERLEFLGDSVLNCVVALRLFERFPKIPEGDLSRLRSYLVKESTLSGIATSLHLGDYLRLGEGELKSGGWRRPSILADTMEAIIGAIFLDAGFEVAQVVVTGLYKPLMEDIDPGSIGKDPKTLLQEYLQGRKLPLPDYQLIATEGEAHCQTFRVECRIPALKIETQGEGGSRRLAEQQAAEFAYQKASQ
jgi:ribonuclease-3